MLQELRRAIRFLHAVLDRFFADDGFRLCASLAYTTLLSVVPVVAVGLAIFTAFPGFDAMTRSVQTFFATYLLPQAVADKVLSYIDEFARNAASLTAVGIVAIGVTAGILIHTIERAFNQIWRVRRKRPLPLRVLMYWGVITLGPVVAAVSITTTSYAITSWMGFTEGTSLAGERYLVVVPWALIVVALTLLYVIVPARNVRIGHAAIGAVVAATAFEIVERFFGLYLTHFTNYTTVYGTLAAVPIFLIWIYVSWVVIVLGAEFVALAPDYAHARAQGGQPARIDFAMVLDVLRILVAAQSRAASLPARRIAGDAHLTGDTTELILERLERTGWVGRLSGDRWALTCNPAVVTVADVYRRLELAPAMPRRRSDERVTRLVANVDDAVSRVTDPLASLVDDAPPSG